MCKNIALDKDFILGIRDCIKRKDGQAFVGNGGFELYLLPRWENFVHSLPKNPRYMFLEYLNDVDKRSVIADIQKKCKISCNLLNRLAEIDSLFIKKTSESMSVFGVLIIYLLLESSYGCYIKRKLEKMCS